VTILTKGHDAAAPGMTSQQPTQPDTQPSTQPGRLDPKKLTTPAIRATHSNAALNNTMMAIRSCTQVILAAVQCACRHSHSSRCQHVRRSHSKCAVCKVHCTVLPCAVHQAQQSSCKPIFQGRPAHPPASAHRPECTPPISQGARTTDSASRRHLHAQPPLNTATEHGDTMADRCGHPPEP